MEGGKVDATRPGRRRPARSRASAADRAGRGWAGRPAPSRGATGSVGLEGTFGDQRVQPRAEVRSPAASSLQGGTIPEGTLASAASRRLSQTPGPRLGWALETSRAPFSEGAAPLARRRGRAQPTLLRGRSAAAAPPCSRNPAPGVHQGSRVRSPSPASTHTDRGSG